MAQHLEVETTIESLAPGGDAVAHVQIGGERRAVFVRHAAAGDVVRTRVDPSTRPARGRLLELLTSSPDRVHPRCPWFSRCGGCDWMHLSPRAQARAHEEHVRAALPAGWQDVAIAMHPAPADLGYRTRALLHVRSERGRPVVGMHRAGTHAPVAVDSCAVLDPAVDRGRASLSALLDGSRGRGEAQIALGHGRRPVVDLRWQGEIAAACFGRLEQAVRAGDLAGARVTLEGASRPAVIGDPCARAVAADGAPLRLAAGGFGQANDAMNGVLSRHVAELVAARPVERAVELYAGSGNFSVLLAPHVRDLVIVEESREACAAARENLAARGLHARVVPAQAEHFTWPSGTHLVLLDPPRTGAREVALRLAGSRVDHVVYVSCDPQTLGRDLRALAATYRATSVALFEMFPQTSHVEIVVALEHVGRRRGAASSPASAD